MQNINTLSGSYRLTGVEPLTGKKIYFRTLFNNMPVGTTLDANLLNYESQANIDRNQTSPRSDSSFL
jgi:hypothetical protein